MKAHLSAILFTSVLLGCGGGDGGDSSPPPTGGNPPPSSDPLQNYINVGQQYNGKKTLAPVNQANMGEIFSYLTLFTPELMPDYVDNITSGSDSDEFCNQGGTVSISSGSTDKEKKLVFSDCVKDRVTFNGRATLRANSFFNSGRLKSSSLIFEDANIKSRMGDYVLRGEVKLSEWSENCSHTIEGVNVLLSHASGVNVLLNLDNETIGANLSSCGSSLVDGLLLSGKIFHSEQGYWSVSTTERIRRKGFLHQSGESGSISVSGYQSKFSFSLKPFTELEGNFNAPKTLNLFTLVDNGVESNFGVHSDYYHESLFYSFKDSDSDGITDTWELFFGLNPNNSSDAISDPDTDGYSNLDEFRYFSSPIDKNALPYVADIAVSTSYSKVINSNDIPISVVLEKLSGHMSKHTMLELTLDENFEIVENNHSYPMACEIEQRTRLICNLGDVVSRFPFKLYARSKVPGATELKGEVNVSVSSFSHDPNTLNNKAKLEFSRSAYMVTMEHSGTLPYSFAMGLVGDVFDFTLTAKTKDMESDILRNPSVTLTTPDFVRVTELKCTSASGVDLECEPNKSFKFDGSSSFVMVKGKIELIDFGQGFLSMDTFTEFTGDVSVDRVNLPVISGKSTDELQSEIDSLSADSELLVSSGIYIGNLDLSSKKISMKANGKVYLYSNPYAERVYRPKANSFIIGKDSSVEGFNIAIHKIVVASDGASFVGNNFDASTYNLLSSTIYSAYEYTGAESSTLTLERNYFSANQLKDSIGEGGKERFSQDCFSVGFVRNYNIKNNIYIGNVTRFSDDPYYMGGCIFVGTGHSRIIRLENNTVKNVDALVSISGLYKAYPEDSFKFDIRLDNNIVIESGAVLAPSLFPGVDAELSATDDSIFIYNNNIDYKLHKGRFLHLGDIFSGDGNKEMDPLLDSNFIPNIGSPAIDSGIDNELKTDFYGNMRPVDGNGDGIIKVDIGAVERQ